MRAKRQQPGLHKEILSIEELLGCAEAQLIFTDPEIIVARKFIECAREQLLRIVKDMEKMTRN